MGDKADPPDPTKKGSTPQSPERAGGEAWRYVGMGGQLAGTVGLFALLGWWLDQKFGWTPWGLTALGLLGVVAGLYQFLRDSLK